MVNIKLETRGKELNYTNNSSPPLKKNERNVNIKRQAEEALHSGGLGSSGKKHFRTFIEKQQVGTAYLDIRVDR